MKLLKAIVYATGYLLGLGLLTGLFTGAFFFLVHLADTLGLPPIAQALLLALVVIFPVTVAAIYASLEPENENKVKSTLGKDKGKEN